MRDPIWIEAGLALILYEECVYFAVGLDKMLALFAVE